MKTTQSKLKGVQLITLPTFLDDRGFFYEGYHEQKFKELGIDLLFKQDNYSFSKKGTLRGLHFQREPHQQDKLVQVLSGQVYDVVADLRPESPTFKQWEGFSLSSDTKQLLFVPTHFAHGFFVTSDEAFVMYKCSDFYSPQSEQGLRWDDPDLAIDWPIHDKTPPSLSPKDEQAPFLRDIAL